MKITDLSLKVKILIFIISNVVLLSISIYFISTAILVSGNIKIEDSESIKNIGRAEESIKEVINQLNIKAADWSAWDDTYKFVEDKNAGYIKSNLESASLASLDINSVVIVDSSGKVVFSKTIDLKNQEELSGLSIVSYINNNPSITRLNDVNDSVSGVISLPEGPIILTSRPIITSQRQGPIKGSLIFTKHFDSILVKRISEITHLSVSIYPYDEKLIDEEILIAKKALDTGVDNFIEREGKNVMAVYKTIFDIQNKPVIILRIESTRDMYNQQENTRNTLLIITAISIILSGVLLSILFSIFITKRFYRLTQQLDNIRETKDISMTIENDGNDEIGKLAASINELLIEINNSQEAERNSVEQTRVAEEELLDKYKETEKMNRLMVDREIRMVELKKENDTLRNEIGKIKK